MSVTAADPETWHPLDPSGRGVGFKEWALVCGSLLQGETSLIFRKGGIAEGRQGFRFKHASFFLFPTHFHEQLEMLRLTGSASVAGSPPAEVTIEGFAQVEFTAWLEELSGLEPLQRFHLLKDEVLQERFSYGEPKGLHVAFLRAYRLPEPWSFPYERSFGGCRSWLQLPTFPGAFASAEPVLGEGEQATRREAVRRALPGAGL